MLVLVGEWAVLLLAAVEVIISLEGLFTVEGGWIDGGAACVAGCPAESGAAFVTVWEPVEGSVANGSWE